jgi:hypothetical protein
MTSDWPGLLDAGDPAAARAVWQEKFSIDSDSLEATWELAEIEERWGDALFFSGEDGAAMHYQAAWRALMPLGTVFSSWEEGQRRMEAYGRVSVKLQAIDPYGKARAGNSAQAHPNFHAVELPANPAPEPVKLEPGPQQSSPAVERQQSDLARVLHSDDHWRHYDLGSRWRETGKELAAIFPESARCAYRWSVDYFELYNRAWNAHMPASRWDSDGGEEIMEVQRMMKALDDSPPGPPPPAWIEALVAGDWRRAWAALGGTVLPPEFNAAAELLSEASRIAGEKPDTPELSGSQA